ncbi:MAG: hypothetical protein U9Q92_02295, partial [archaeon]|nr:hypothetical protein [archaeon]
MYEDAANVRVVWHYLAFNKEIGYLRTDMELETVKRNILRKIVIIEDAIKEGDFLPNASKLCLWCEFQKICPVHKHKFSAENEKKVHESGVELVNRYALLKKSRSDIDDEIDYLRDALVEYCRKNEMAAVEGDGCVAKVSRSAVVKYPRAGDEERGKLEEFLRKSKLWDRVSCLDAHALNRLMKETLVDRSVLEKIRSFGTEEVNYKVSLGKKGDGG